MAFPDTALDVKVEISPGADLTADPTTWTWTDITSSVRLRDGISITVGRPDEAARVDPSTCRLRLDNRTGNFTPRNPLGAYYGSLARNTPLRVQVNPGSGYVTRFSGFVSAWPPRWDKSGRDASVPIEANGILRRLGQGNAPVRSPYRRSIMSPVNTGMLAYWPCEDDSDADQAASAIPGQPGMTVAGTVDFGDAAPALSTTGVRRFGTMPLPDLTGGGSLTGVVPAGSSSPTAWAVQFFSQSVDFGSGVSNALTIASWRTPGGTYERWELHQDQSAGGSTTLRAIDSSGVSTDLIVLSGVIVGPDHYTIDAIQSGSNIDVRLWFATFLEGSFSGAGTLAQITEFSANPNRTVIDPADEFIIGHIRVWDHISPPKMTITEVLGWSGTASTAPETATDRLTRLCVEDGISLSMPTVSAEFETAMGSQPDGTALELYQQCADADQGVLHEDGFGLAYVPRQHRYNRAVDLALDFDLGQVAEPPEPADDDQQLRNEWKVKRPSGSSATARDQDSVDRYGLYDDEAEVRLDSDSQLAPHAQWRVHLGTVDEMRWPRIDINLAASPELVNAWLVCDVQSRVTAVHPPDEVAGDDIDVIIEGWTEFLGFKDWDVSLNTSPASPWDVLGLTGENFGVELPMAGELVTDGASGLVNLDATGLDVDLSDGQMVRLTMTIDDPFQLQNLNFLLGVGGFTNFIRWRFDVETVTTHSAKPNESTVFTLLLSEVDAVGGTITLSSVGVPSVLSGFTHARLQADDNAVVAVTIDLHSVEIVQPALSGAYCSITFDDGDDSIMTLAYPKMAELGFKGTEYVVVETVGTPDHVTLVNLQTLADAGWEVGAHSFSSASHSASYTGQTAAQVSSDLASVKSWLETNFPNDAHTMAYPNGEFFDTTDSTAVESLVTAAGFAAGRTILSSSGSTVSLQIESLPPPIPTRLYAMSGVSELSVGQRIPANLLATGGMLDKLASNGGWMVLAFHQVTAGTPASTTEISQSDFDDIMDALAAKNITVAPVRDVLALLEPQLGRLAADDSTLNVAVDSDDTSFSVRPNGAKWTTDSDDFDPPIPVRVGGELVEVTAVSDPAVFVAVGTAAHADNAGVTPGLPAGLAEGDYMLLFAATRNSGVGTVADLAGWSSVQTNGNMRMFGRIATASETAPFVTFNGTAAGDTCSAQICAFRGLWRQVTGSVVESSVDQLNASAQNVAFPMLDLLAPTTDYTVTILTLWKHDDWTSVAPPTGFTEIGEPSSTLGNDHGLYWAYQIGTTRRMVHAGTVTVTGGGAAISRASLTAIAAAQTFTVTRSVNGVAKSHAIGAVLEVDDAYVLGL